MRSVTSHLVAVTLVAVLPSFPSPRTTQVADSLVRFRVNSRGCDRIVYTHYDQSTDTSEIRSIKKDGSKIKHLFDSSSRRADKPTPWRRKGLQIPGLVG